MKDQNYPRCPWANLKNPDYLAYHDNEWGKPVHDDTTHFEFLILEGAQAGLSWETILKRRDHYKKAFHSFNWKEVSKFDENKIEELMQNSLIIRNRKKIESAINNAKAFEKICKEFGSFDHYVWGFVNGKPIVNHFKKLQEIPPETTESKKLSQDLKKRGFAFVGPTIIYAYMQATGLVNDHLVSCFRHPDFKKK